MSFANPTKRPQNEPDLAVDEAQRHAGDSPYATTATPATPATGATGATGATLPPGVPGGSDDPQTPDAKLVQETRIQIRGLVQEIAQISQSDCSVEEFYEGFLTRVTSALASVGSAIWTVENGDQPVLQYQINMSQTGLAEDETARVRHHLLLRKLVQNPEPSLVHPESGGNDPDEAGNPTPFLLVIAPLVIDNRTVGLVEIFQRPGSGPTTQRGYLRFLVQMSDLASDFLKNRRLRLFQEQQQLWDRLEYFIRSIHQCLDVKETAYAIANEGRRLTECDRVSIAICRGRRCPVEVVSGLDSFDRRAAEVKRLGKLSSVVVQARQPLWYDGDDSQLPPQVEEVLHHYLDVSHAKMVSVTPLYRPESISEADSSDTADRDRHPIGVLIVEQLGDSRITPAIRRRVDVIAQHGSDALSNALQHDQIPFMPVWRTLGKVGWIADARQLPTTLLVAAALVGLIASMFFVPYSFNLASDGSLVPKVRHEIYAPFVGRVTEIHLPEDPTALVEQNAVIALLENPELDQEIEELHGKSLQLAERIKALKQSQLHAKSAIEELTLEGEEQEALESLETTHRQLNIKLYQKNLLQVRCPIRGQITDWQLHDRLIRRTVDRGQHLMTVIDPEADWQLELEMPEQEMGHLMAARKELGDPLEVTFVLASHSNRRFKGTISQIDQRAGVYESNINSVKVKVDINKDELPQDAIREGTKLTAKVHCGSRSIGYVLFHDLMETVQAKVLFWF